MTMLTEVSGPHAALSPPGWSATDRRVVWAIAIVGLAGYALLGMLLHPFVIPGAEWDGYVQRATDLHAGGTGLSHTHPYGLPLLLSGLMWTGLDAFTAGRLVSAAGGAALLAASYGLLRQWTSRPVAAVGCGIVAANPLTLQNAQLATSDMPAVGLMTVALWCWVLAARSLTPRIRLAAFGGLLAGIAASFRLPSAFPAAGALVLLATGPWSGRAKYAAAMAVTYVAGLAPHLWANKRASGTYFGNDNWRNLVLKYQHGFDLRLALLEFDKAADQLAAHWPEWLAAGLGDFARLLGSGMAETFAPAVGSGVKIVLSLLLSGLLVVAVLDRDRGRRILGIAALASAGATAISFSAIDRMLLPLLPVLTVLGLVAAQRLWPKRPVALAVGLCSLGGMVWQAPATLARFVAEHGRAEVPVVQELAAHYDGLCNVQTVVRLNSFDVSAYITVMPRLPDEAGCTGAELWEQVRTTAVARATDYVVIARETAPDLVDALVAVPPPPGYEVLRRDDVLVVRCPPPATSWPRDAAVQRDGAALDLTLTVDEPDAKVLIGYFFIRDLTRRWHAITLQRDPQRPGHYSARLRVGALPVEEMLFVPAMMQHDNTFRHGPGLRVGGR